MRAECFIGVKPESPGVKYLVHRRFLARWVYSGWRKVRDARPTDGSLPERKWWCPLNRSVPYVSQVSSEAAEAVVTPVSAASLSPAVEPERKTQRRSRRKKGA